MNVMCVWLWMWECVSVNVWVCGVWYVSGEWYMIMMCECVGVKCVLCVILWGVVWYVWYFSVWRYDVWCNVYVVCGVWICDVRLSVWMCVLWYVNVCCVSVWMCCCECVNVWCVSVNILCVRIVCLWRWVLVVLWLGLLGSVGDVWDESDGERFL